MRDFFSLASLNGWNVEGSKERDGFLEMSWGKPMIEGDDTVQFQAYYVEDGTADKGEEQWIQIRAAGGERGWLYERWVHLLVFPMPDRYLIVERLKLQEWLEENMTKEYVTLAHQALMHPYKKMDGSLWTLVKTYHLKALALGEMKEAQVKRV